MEISTYRVYRYRWVVLLVFMLSVAVNQLLWITFAPITSAAAAFYQVSDLSIGILSVSFMIVYIFLSIPASWVIDTYGIRSAVGIAAALAAVSSLASSRERPPSPPCPPEQEERSLMRDGLRDLLRKRGFVFLMVVFFVGLGGFKAV